MATFILVCFSFSGEEWQARGKLCAAKEIKWKDGRQERKIYFSHQEKKIQFSEEDLFTLI